MALNNDPLRSFVFLKTMVNNGNSGYSVNIGPEVDLPKAMADMCYTISEQKYTAYV